MLETLQIKDFALIDDVEVTFRPGFNVLTGETGAGKSIVVSALNLVLGARATAASVRQGRENARIDAVFSLPAMSDALQEILHAQAIEPEDGALHITRIISSEGRSRAYVNGTLAPVSVLASIGEELVDLHGQHEHQSLLKHERQLDLLDAFGQLTLEADRVREAVAELRRIETELESLESDDRDRLRRLEFHRFELEEIDKANLQPGEEEELRQLRSRMTNAEEIVELRASLTARLSEGEENSAALELMAQSLSDMERLAKLDATYAPLFEHLQRVYTDFESIAASIGSDSEDLEYDPDQLNSINARLSALSDLKRKYGPTIEDILRHRDEIAAEVDQYDRRDELLAALKADREKAHANALQRASDLSKKRSAAATKLEKRIQSILNSLEMGGGNFKVSLTSCDLNLRGAERAEFLISANAGESPKPLRQIASGGEISRVMLAIKAVFADVDPVYTLVFDEIDAGIGGAVANHVASTMALLARDHQVICVTHLAQIAAQANAHFLVSKSTAKRRTMTEVAGIEGEPRVQEIARLLDGSVSDASMHHARSLLSQTTRRSA